jgi:predicted RNA-binding Zn-ribbon protein involved in translation (DUF1610 family)
MNICLHGNKTDPDPATQWHCHHCKHVLGDIVNGRCIPLHRVILSYDRPTIVVCPVCGKEEFWYSEWDKREG